MLLSEFSPPSPPPPPLFPRPLINRKLEEKVCGEGPSLEVIFEADAHLMELQDGVYGSISKAFSMANAYRAKFEPYREFYVENEDMDVEAMTQEEHGWLLVT